MLDNFSGYADNAVELFSDKKDAYNL